MRLQKYIEERGISLTKMAARCNISYGMLYRVYRQLPTTLENAVRIEIFTKGKVKAIELMPEEKIKQIKSEIAKGY